MIVLSSSLAPTIAILVLVLALFASVIIYLIYRKSKGHRILDDEDPKAERKYLMLRYKGEKEREKKEALKKKRQLENRDRKHSSTNDNN